MERPEVLAELLEDGECLTRVDGRVVVTETRSGGIIMNLSTRANDIGIW